MATVPVESMKTGGMLWFPDLTLSDPYMILPVLTSATLLLTVEVNSHSLTLKAPITTAADDKF